MNVTSPLWAGWFIYLKMAARRTKKQQTQKVVRVYCSDCQTFVRDTEGQSFNIETGEFFMGDCPEGVSDGAVKIKDGKPVGRVFADKARECKYHKGK